MPFVSPTIIPAKRLVGQAGGDGSGRNLGLVAKGFPEVRAYQGGDFKRDISGEFF